MNANPENYMPFAPIPEILKDLCAGRIIVLVDDRESEGPGDLVCAAEKVTAENLNFMVSHARGLIRLSLPAEHCEELQLEVQSRDSSLPLQKAFTISIDARNLEGSGISVRNRVKTILAAIDENCKPSDLVRPGHVLPLRARPGGVLVRAGKTEGSVDLARLAGLKAAGVFCEMLDQDGEPMGSEARRQFARQHGLKICTIEEVIEFRLSNEPIIQRVENVDMPTDFGDFRLIAFRSMGHPEPHLALCKGGVGELNEFGKVIPHSDPILVRVQPECLTGCVFGTSICSCGDHLSMALNRIEEEGKGAFVLLRRTQGARMEDVFHPHALGVPKPKNSPELPGTASDRRDFGLGSQILRALGLGKLRVLSNSRQKIYGLEGFGLSVVERIQLRDS